MPIRQLIPKTFKVDLKASDITEAEFPVLKAVAAVVRNKPEMPERLWFTVVKPQFTVFLKVFSKIKAGEHIIIELLGDKDESPKLGHIADASGGYLAVEPCALKY